MFPPIMGSSHCIVKNGDALNMCDVLGNEEQSTACTNEPSGEDICTVWMAVN